VRCAFSFSLSLSLRQRSFCWLYIAKKLYEKIKSAKITWHLRFSIAIIRSKFKKTRQISMQGSMLAIYRQKAT
jgi:hypothetical protein